MNNKPSISIHTLGCKLNQAESEAMARKFFSSGFMVDSGDIADVIILNTCSVTHSADRKARQQLRTLRRLNPRSLIVATGCYAELAGAELKEYGADIVVGNCEKETLPQVLPGRIASVPNRKQGTTEDKTERTRSFVKIQDGCRNFCSYCIVPLLRRDVYCKQVDTIIEEINARVEEGYREVVLTGTEIGSYYSDGVGLSDLITGILGKTGIERLHLSSLQPQHINDMLLDIWSNNRLVRHFHLALQSGSNSILQRMKRRYTIDEFENAVNMIRRAVPDASVTTDVIIGFPGESDTEFRESYDFCSRMKFSAIHVFVYSARPGTAAAGMACKVSEKLKRERSQGMLSLATRCAGEFAACYTGRMLPVLWENEVKPGTGVYTGLTNNYIRTYASSAHGISNTISDVCLMMPVGQAGMRVVRRSTRGNYGELWGELNEDQDKGHAALVKGGSGGIRRRVHGTC